MENAKCGEALPPTLKGPLIGSLGLKLGKCALSHYNQVIKNEHAPLDKSRQHGNNEFKSSEIVEGNVGVISVHVAFWGQQNRVSLAPYQLEWIQQQGENGNDMVLDEDNNQVKSKLRGAASPSSIEYPLVGTIGNLKRYFSDMGALSLAMSLLPTGLRRLRPLGFVELPICIPHSSLFHSVSSSSTVSHNLSLHRPVMNERGVCIGSLECAVTLRLLKTQIDHSANNNVVLPPTRRYLNETITRAKPSEDAPKNEHKMNTNANVIVRNYRPTAVGDTRCPIEPAIIHSLNTEKPTSASGQDPVSTCDNMVELDDTCVPNLSTTSPSTTIVEESSYKGSKSEMLQELILDAKQLESDMNASLSKGSISINKQQQDRNIDIPSNYCQNFSQRYIDELCEPSGFYNIDSHSNTFGIGDLGSFFTFCNQHNTESNTNTNKKKEPRPNTTN